MGFFRLDDRSFEFWMDQDDLIWNFTKVVDGHRIPKSKVALPRKNNKAILKIPVPGKKGVYRNAIDKSKETRAWEKNLVSMLDQLSPVPLDKTTPHFRAGVWFCEIIVLCNGVRRELAPRHGDKADKVKVEHLLTLDDECCTEAVRDGLEFAGLIDDDARFRGTNSTSLLRPQGCALWVQCSRVDDRLEEFLTARSPEPLHRYASAIHTKDLIS